MGQRVVQVDAFTREPFAGNPAAVCVMEEARDERWMQAVAREMNLSETAFLVPRPDGWDLRWFTPVLEVDLCGHATLASAHVLWEDAWIAPTEMARFQTRSGELRAERDGDGAIVLDFPAVRATEVEPPPGLADALGIVPACVGRNRFDLLVVVDAEEDVRALRPDTTRLARLDARGIIVTAPSVDPEYDFVSRFFAPAAGVDEDPVTGSAHCCLAPYWSERLGKTDLTGYQASARGGVVGVRCREERVHLVGHAVTVLRGQLLC